VRAIALFAFLSSCALIASPASAQSPPNGGAAYEESKPKAEPPIESGAAPLPGTATPVVPGTKAVLLADGTAAAPELAPPQVKAAIWAANRLQDKPYRYGGGHASFEDSGYDCSGTISYALRAAGVLASPLDSGSFMRWAEAGRGQWITVHTNPGHAFVVIAGLRLDTSAAFVRAGRATKRGKRARVSRKALERGPRWRPTRRPAKGFTARHPAGL